MNINKLIGIALIGSLFAVTLTDGPVEVTATGVVPFIVSFNTDDEVTDQDPEIDGSTTAGNFANVTMDDYDRVDGDGEGVTDYYEIADIVKILDFDANHTVDISLQKGGWTSLPSDYAGDKLEDGSENTEFLVKVAVTNAGYVTNAAEGLVVQGSFGAFTGLNNTNTPIISGGTASHGVESGAFNVQGRILFDWLKDIPGTYTVKLTCTIAEGS